MQARRRGIGFLAGVRRAPDGTTWHRADPLALVVIGLLTACGGNSESASRSNDFGAKPDASVVPDGDAPPPDGDPDSGGVYPPAASFEPGDPALCGEGTVWEQILSPTEADARARMSTLSDRAERPLTIYRGTVTVHQTLGDVYPDGNIDLVGPVIARLQPGGLDVLGTGYGLYVRSPETAQYFLVEQTTEWPATAVSRIMPENSSPGGFGEVDASVDVPVLEDAPPTLPFDVVATSPDPTFSFRIELRASLE